MKLALVHEIAIIYIEKEINTRNWKLIDTGSRRVVSLIMMGI